MPQDSNSSETEKKVNISDIAAAPTELPESGKDISVDKYESLLAKFTRVSEDKVEIQEELNSLRVSRATSAILDKLIIPYAKYTFRFMCIYCLSVGGLLLLSVFGRPLPEHVLEVLVGSTAASVLGLVGMVLTGIFVGARGKR